MKDLIKLAESYGAEVEVDYSPHDQAYSINIAAPDGMQWVEGGCVNMLGVYYSYVKGDKKECIETLKRRIAYGLEPDEN